MKPLKRDNQNIANSILDNTTSNTNNVDNSQQIVYVNRRYESDVEAYNSLIINARRRFVLNIIRNLNFN